MKVGDCVKITTGARFYGPPNYLIDQLAIITAIESDHKGHECAVVLCLDGSRFALYEDEMVALPAGEQKEA